MKGETHISLADSDSSTSTTYRLHDARVRDVAPVQGLSDTTWQEEGYRHYRALHTADPTSIVVATTLDDRIAGFAGLERIEYLDLGKEMPQADHDPRNGWVKLEGDVLYVTGVAVAQPHRSRGLSGQLIEYVAARAKADPQTDHLVTLHAMGRPASEREARFWEHHGFRQNVETYNPEWKAHPEAEASGSVLYVKDVRA